MGSVSNLVYYASVSKGTTILAEHSGPGDDLAMVAIECLGKVPSLHSRFTYTTNGRMFNCLMDGAFTYCAIVDQALGKQKAFGFLEKVRDEFKLLLMSQGWALDGVALEAYCLNDDFMVVYRHLVKPLVGIPQKELDHMWEQTLARQSAESGADAGDDSEDHTCLLPEHHVHSEKKGNHLLESLTWKANSKRVQQQVVEVKEIMMTNSGKALDKGQKLQTTGGGTTPTYEDIHMSRSPSRRMEGRQMASYMWWHTVKVILIFDLIVCLLLFAVWLGLCKGFQCIGRH
ncbi:hypothetical protein BDL97_10G089300 [Sphagnum fallax]|jgi:hypothetical protein|nr:hypothetical protein BDL97_10G089300 [Sphagnum fallax]KAH8950504.1 hypothetical protein BDL97_10G089300 [Sphagnum fallax]